LTTYVYNALGNVTSITTVTSVGNQTRTFVYDGLGRLTSETYPESGTTTYAYDSATGCAGSSSGDRIKRTDAVGNVACYAYDLQHRKTSITYSGPYASRTPNRYFVYDAATVNGVTMANAAGRLAEAYTCTTCTPTPTKITDVGFSYTVRGEVADTYQSSPHSSGYYHVSATYWAHGKVQTLSGVPGVPAITYGVDNMGRSTTASASSGQNPVTSLSYNTMNQVTGITFGSGDSDSYSYDASTGHMTGFSFNVNGQSLTATIQWFNNGTVQTFSTTDPFNTSNNGTCSFAYDDMVRVSSANCAPTGGPAYWSQIFSFDPFGNISKSGSVAFQPTYSTATNRISSLPGASVSYDANGNLLNDGTYTYDWTAFGKASTVNGIAITYDALGRDVEHNNAGSYTQIVYDTARRKIATMSGQTLQKGFVGLPTGATAVYQPTGLTWYRHADNLGSSRLATTPTRAVAADRAYAPYGEAFNETGVQDRSFAGHDEDTVSALYDAPARLYSPTQGRWLAADPSGLNAIKNYYPQTLDRYSYVLNNPLQWTDPNGLDCWDPTNPNPCTDCSIAPCVDGGDPDYPSGGGGDGHHGPGLELPPPDWGGGVNNTDPTSLPSCFSIFLDTAKAPLPVVKDAVQRWKDIILAAASGGPAAITRLANAISEIVGAGASDIADDATNAAIAAQVSQLLGGAVTAVLKKLPEIIAATVDVAIAIGIGREVAAVSKGQCR
jgi:RHS repeat-associated protein